MPSASDNNWFVYMIRCEDDSLYTGITTDMARRWREHSPPTGERSRTDRQGSGRCKVAACDVAHLGQGKSNRGAKFFRTRKPLQLAYIESGHDRSSAARREAAIKRLPRAAKLQLLTTDQNELSTLDGALLPMLDT